MREDLLAAQGERKDLQVKVDEVRKDFTELRDRERKAEEAAQELEAQNGTLQRNYVRLERDFKDRSTELSEKNLILTNIREHYKIDPQQATVPPIRGLVRKSDSDTGILVLNVGSENQVQLNYEFKVVRGDKFIGSVRVKDLYPTWCGAVVVREMLKEPIQPGDQVVTVLN